MNSSKPVAAGLVGCGIIGKFRHIPAMMNVPGLRLAGISDIDPQRLREAGEPHGIHARFTDYRDLLALDEIELVTVATRVEDHYRVAMDAFAAGKHVFCEKPLADSVGKSREMIEAARSAGLLLGVNFELRAYPSQQRMRHLIRSNAIGQVKVLRLITLSPGPGSRTRGAAGQIRLKQLSNEGGGAVFDCGVHYFDQARWLLGSEFRSIWATGLNVEGFDNPDHVVVLCEMTDGSLVQIEESWIYAHRSTEPIKHNVREAIGTRGIVRVDMVSGYDEDLRDHVLWIGEEERREWDETHNTPFDTQYADFARSIREGRLINIASGEDGLRAMEAALDALESAKENPIPSTSARRDSLAGGGE